MRKFTSTVQKAELNMKYHLLRPRHGTWLWKSKIVHIPEAIISTFSANAINHGSDGSCHIGNLWSSGRPGHVCELYFWQIVFTKFNFGQKWWFGKHWDQLKLFTIRSCSTQDANCRFSGSGLIFLSTVNLPILRHWKSVQLFIEVSCLPFILPTLLVSTKIYPQECLTCTFIWIM